MFNLISLCSSSSMKTEWPYFLKKCFDSNSLSHVSYLFWHSTNQLLVLFWRNLRSCFNSFFHLSFRPTAAAAWTWNCLVVAPVAAVHQVYWSSIVTQIKRHSGKELEREKESILAQRRVLGFPPAMSLSLGCYYNERATLHTHRHTQSH